MGVLTLPLLVLLAQADPTPGAFPDIWVLPPGPPLVIKPVDLDHVVVVGAEPRYAAPTRLDKIGRIWAPVTVNGQGPYRLVLATGASHTALTPHLAEALGVRGKSHRDSHVARRDRFRGRAHGAGRDRWNSATS